MRSCSARRGVDSDEAVHASGPTTHRGAGESRTQTTLTLQPLRACRLQLHLRIQPPCALALGSAMIGDRSANPQQFRCVAPSPATSPAPHVRTHKHASCPLPRTGCGSLRSPSRSSSSAAWSCTSAVRALPPPPRAPSSYVGDSVPAWVDVLSSRLWHRRRARPLAGAPSADAAAAGRVQGRRRRQRGQHRALTTVLTFKFSCTIL